MYCSIKHFYFLFALMYDCFAKPLNVRMELPHLMEDESFLSGPVFLSLQEEVHHSVGVISLVVARFRNGQALLLHGAQSLHKTLHRHA